MGDYFVCSKTDPVVETKAGKVRGFRLKTTYAFHGIHYAEADRFQMPQPVKPWKGIKNALAYGYVCPLLKQDEQNMEVLVPHRYWPQDEHCQNLYVWTQSLDPGAKSLPEIGRASCSVGNRVPFMESITPRRIVSRCRSR